MDEETKKMFAEMFGEQKEDTPVASVTETTPEPVVEKDDDADGNGDEHPEVTAEQFETEEKTEAKADDEGCDPKLLSEAKKELGIGGAAFCDELYAQCPDVFQRLKDAGKTLSGFFNFAYSYALDEYVKNNGRHNGGGYWNLPALSEKYLDPSVKEGYTVGEPKVRNRVATKMETPARTVEKVAKKAARAAKKATRKRKGSDDATDKKDIPNPFENFDWSSIK